MPQYKSDETDAIKHLAYYSVLRMAKYPASGTRFTDTKGPTCISCAQVKQTKNIQSQKGIGAGLPINRSGKVN